MVLRWQLPIRHARACRGHHVLTGIYGLTGIHALKASGIKDVDGRNKSGHDEGVSYERPGRALTLIEADTGIRRPPEGILAA